MMAYLGIVSWLVVDRSVTAIQECKEEKEALCLKALDDFTNDLPMLYWMFEGAKFICVTQIYEWLSMKLIINWQSKRDFTMAIIDIEDLENRKHFFKMEVRR